MSEPKPHGKRYPKAVKEAVLTAYAETGYATEAAQTVGVPQRTANEWVQQAQAAQLPEVATEPIASVWDRVQRQAAKRAHALIDELEPTPEALQAIARMAHVAGNLHLDATVGRRGQTVQVQHQYDIGPVLAALHQARSMPSLPIATETVVSIEGEVRDADERRGEAGVPEAVHGEEAR